MASWFELSFESGSRRLAKKERGEAVESRDRPTGPPPTVGGSDSSPREPRSLSANENKEGQPVAATRKTAGPDRKEV